MYKSLQKIALRFKIVNGRYFFENTMFICAWRRYLSNSLEISIGMQLIDNLRHLRSFLLGFYCFNTFCWQELIGHCNCIGCFVKFYLLNRILSIICISIQTIASKLNDDKNECYKTSFMKATLILDTILDKWKDDNENKYNNK